MSLIRQQTSISKRTVIKHLFETLLAFLREIWRHGRKEERQQWVGSVTGTATSPKEIQTAGGMRHLVWFHGGRLSRTFPHMRRT